MYYRKASKFHIHSIKKLWNEVFGDSDDYIHRFITHFGIENGYVCENNNEIIAMAFALPTTFSINEVQDLKIQRFKNSKIQRLQYIYACATHQDFRGQGIMKNLLATIYEDACNEDFAGIFLNAADLSLANYYSKLGFEDFFFQNHSFYCNHKRQKVCTQSTNCENSLYSLSLNIISPEIYHRKRVKKLEKTCFIDWNEEFFSFINQIGTQFCEYENTIFSFKTRINIIIVDELLGDTPHEIISELLFKHFSEIGVVHIRSLGNVYCCGQIKWCKQLSITQNYGYFAFTME